MPAESRVGRLLVLLALLVPAPLAARDVTAGALRIEQPWARATPAGAPVGGGYLTITNAGSGPERLIGGTFAAASGFEFHRMSMTGGVMSMRPTGPLPIAPGGRLVLEPAGTHIMFTGLKRRLVKGETVEGTLIFDHAGTVPVSFVVEAIGARTPAGAEGASMPGMDMR